MSGKPMLLSQRDVIFGFSKITSRWLSSIDLPNIRTSELEGFDARDREYDLLAEYFEEHIDTEAIIKLVNRGAKNNA